MTQLPLHIDPSEVDVPPNWRLIRISDAYEQLPAGKRYDTKTVSSAGRVPVINQSLDGLLGYHDDPPGVEASFSDPVVTFANHTCAMRVMRQPFSSIQNVFPMRGRAGVCDTLYLYYSTNNRQGIEDYKGHHPVWRNSFIALPNLKTQKAIVQVLAAFDDLIENNRRRVQVLGEMARAIYREWFVKFRYPGHEQVSLVDSALGHIPEGWEVRRVSELFVRNIGGGWGSEHKTEQATEPAYVIRGTDIPRISVADISTVPFRFHGDSNLQSRRLEAGDIVFEVSGGSKGQPVGRSVLMHKTLLDNFDAAVMCASFCKLIRSNPSVLVPSVLFRLLQDAYSTGQLNAFQVQSTGITNFRWKPFLELFQVAIPPMNVQQRFAKTLAPIEEQIVRIGQCSQTLAKTRDLLLPKLVTGQIDASTLNLGQVLEEAVA